MRTIKFRGKDPKTGKWYYGDLITDLTPKGSMITCPAIGTTEGTIGTFFVSPESVGQYTGMYDSRGTEIYEGDIVSWLFFHGSLEVGRVEYKREEAQFRIVNRFSTIDKRESTSTIQNKRNLMVRGNVIDNPELMEGGVSCL